MEYLVTMTTRVPDGTSEEAFEDLRIREAARALGLDQRPPTGSLGSKWAPTASAFGGAAIRSEAGA